MAADTYDYKMRCTIGDEPISSTRSNKGDYFGWYVGEEVILQITGPDGLLEIKLDKKGSVSLKRSGTTPK